MVAPDFTDLKKTIDRLIDLSNQQYDIGNEYVRILLKDARALFRYSLRTAGYDKRSIEALKQKFFDAGRRSAPWKPTSSRVPGRPQDGADGNRILRWKLDKEHKFYSEEVPATLVEIKYFLQALSFENAPKLPDETLRNSFVWLLGHPIEPGLYLDPIQLITINLNAVLKDPRLIQSCHLIPLDRGGKHIPQNAFLMLAKSNQLQGNLTLDELLKLMDQILERHKKIKRSVDLKQ